jgi:murein L,D-transpeptidase YcbB/YkuD
MSLFRAAGFLVGAMAASLSAAPLRAAASDEGASAAVELALPEPPPVVVTIEAPAIAAPVESARALKPAPDLTVPAVPDVTVLVEAAPRPSAAASPAADITLPPLPDAPLTFTVADLMADALASRLADPKFQLHHRLQRREREAVAAFYAIGGFKPLWIDGGSWTPAARLVIARLKAAQEDGLDPADYSIPALGVLSAGDSAADLAEAELKLSASAILYARDARGARIDPARLSRLITPKLDIPAADAILTQLASYRDPGAVLAAFNPAHAGYRALKSKLAEVRATRPSGSRLEGDILANMERWRWLPADLGTRHIWVNVPEYRLRVLDHGRLMHEARVIVGKPDTPTPLFSEMMDHAIVNPSWNVPPSIFKNEFYSDPAYAASRGYQVVRTKDGIRIRQPPGERNALGFIKFMFPNQHAVYLHDTPSRNLFGAERRAFSHGCVRLDQPFRFGQIVLGDEWTEPRLRSLIGRGERTIRLPQRIPVHLTYFTTFIDEKGELRQIADLYGVNNKVRVALGLPSDGTQVAEPRRPKQVRAHPPRRRPVQREETVMRAPQPVMAQPGLWWWVR